MKAIIVFALLLTSMACYSQTSQDTHKACVTAALDSIYTAQVNKLKLTPLQRGVFTVEWYGNMINNDPEFKKIEDQLKMICAKAYVMALPLDTEL